MCVCVVCARVSCYIKYIASADAQDSNPVNDVNCSLKRGRLELVHEWMDTINFHWLETVLMLLLGECTFLSF